MMMEKVKKKRAQRKKKEVFPKIMLLKSPSAVLIVKPCIEKEMSLLMGGCRVYLIQLVLNSRMMGM